MYPRRTPNVSRSIPFEQCPAPITIICWWVWGRAQHKISIEPCKERGVAMATKPDVMKVYEEAGKRRFTMDVALEDEGHPSSTGKTQVFFTTNGNKPIDGGFVLGVNLYRKA